MILTEIDLGCECIGDVAIIKINRRGDINRFNGNSKVKAIVCCRRTAVKISEMNFPNLKLIQLTSEGFDNVPLDIYKQKEIKVSNAGGAYSIPIAEMIIYAILKMTKKYNKNPNNQRFRIFRNYKYIVELSGKKVLILGAGKIGVAVAERLKGFGVELFAYDPYCEKKEIFKIYRNKKELIGNIADFDYVISTLPGTDETYHFVNMEFLMKMKSTSVFINIGRRSTICEKDLFYVLKRKLISGAVLDMFEKIPNPITNKFRRLSNVIVFPGVAAISQEVNQRLRQYILKNLLLLLESNEPIGVVNK